MVRIKSLLTLSAVVLLLATMVTVPLAMAGDVNNPEVTDKEGDSSSGSSSRDILWGYMGHETNSTFAVVMGVSSLETFTDPSQILNFPVTDYEFYFTINGANYAAVATVPVHGPFGIEIRYELRTVEYNGSVPATETSKTSIATATYSAADGIINITVDKADVGGPIKGDAAENLWLATYSRQREGQTGLSDPVLEDRAPDYGYGDQFIFVGTPGIPVVKLEISSDSARTVNITAFQQLKFEIAIFNNGTMLNQIAMNNSSAAKFTVSFSPQTMTLEPQTGNNVTLVVKIRDIKNVKDGDTLVLQVWAETNVGNESKPDMKNSNYLTFTIKASVPRAKPPEKSALDNIIDWVKDNWKLIVGLIVLLVVLVVVYVVVSKVRSRKGEEFEDLDVKVKGGEPSIGPTPLPTPPGKPPQKGLKK